MQSLHIQISPFHCLIFLLKALRDLCDLYSYGKFAHKKGDLFKIVSKPYLTVFLTSFDRILSKMSKMRSIEQNKLTYCETLSLVISHSLILKTLGMAEHPWPHLTKLIEWSNRSLHGYDTMKQLQRKQRRHTALTHLHLIIIDCCLI